MTTAVAGQRQPRTVTGEPRPRSRKRRRTNITATVILIIGGLYCVLPALWILIAATKSNAQLFSSAPLRTYLDSRASTGQGSRWSGIAQRAASQVSRHLGIRRYFGGAEQLPRPGTE